jgi:myxalamid-type polyketide synthase MxaB
MEHPDRVSSRSEERLPDRPFRVALSDYGSPDNLRLEQLNRKAPGPGEVEIEVRAASLNFRDVLNALGMLQTYYAEHLGIYNAADLNLGFECAGTIVALGEGVSGFAVGDAVMAIAEGSFASFVTVNASFVAPKPTGLSFDEAAAVPAVFATAYYGLHALADIRAGERVLIHAAAGGVGQAAVQLAQAAGAEVFATASPGKWAFLQAQGIEHVMNSRTLDFADEIMRRTQGEGVHVVLNSLSGDFVDQSFAALAPQGRFIEIGKLGIWDAEQVATRRPDVAYYPFELGDVASTSAERIASMLGQLCHWFETGRLKAPPLKVFSALDVSEAFRYVQQAKHIGKVVLSFAAAPSPTERVGSETATIREDGSYLITGGLGGLGLKVAQHLAQQGARYLALSGRRGAATPEAQDALRELEQSGVQVAVIQADVSRAEEVARMLEACQSLAPLRGIIHAAGVVDDGVLQQQTPERFARVMGPKVQGAWHLHALTEDVPLDFFVCFSSTVSWMRAAGQGNYAAANAFLDALAHHRRACGMHGLSINWGAWAEVGMAANLSLDDVGIGKIAPERGVEVLSELIEASSQHGTAQVGVIPINWSLFQKHIPHAAPFLSQLLPRTQRAKPAVAEPILHRLQASPPEQRAALLKAYLHAQLTHVLRLDASQSVSPTQAWHDLGLDSLMAVELRTRLHGELHMMIPLDKLHQGATLETIAAFILDRLDVDSHAQGPSPAPPQAEERQENILPKAIVQQIPQLLAIVDAQRERQVLIDGRWVCDFASCNYLGLDLHPKVSDAIPEALTKWGVHPSWTRAVASPGIYDTLERELANLVGAPETLVFPSISLLHLGVLQLLAGHNGVILKDTAAHHSIYEACCRAQANGTEWGEFRHNDPQDLAQKLASYRLERTKIIAVDGIFSMAGHYPPLREYAELAKTYNAIIYIDDGHGIGIMGENPSEELPYGYKGNGIVRHVGLDYAEDRIVYVAGLSKAFSSYGAFITCTDPETKAYIANAGTFGYSGPSPVASLASALAGLEVNREEGDERRKQIYYLTHKLVTTAQNIGFEVENENAFPIVGVVVGQVEQLIQACQLLWEHQILITPAFYPVVPKHRCLMRFSMTAANTEAEVDQAIEALQAVWKKLHP